VSDLVGLPSGDFKIFIPDFNFLLYDAVNDDPEDYDFDETLNREGDSLFLRFIPAYAIHSSNSSTTSLKGGISCPA